MPNATIILDAENTLQPDAILCSQPRKGGRVWLNDKNYLCGSPELVCEIAASSASIDLHEKFRVYRRNGVQEYLVWLTLEKKVRWFQLIDEEYVEMKERAGKLSSVVFPGLILDVKALIKMDRKRVIAALK
jgi:Uma2 family endonuclease